jgi:hypothetical protein
MQQNPTAHWFHAPVFTKHSFTVNIVHFINVISTTKTEGKKKIHNTEASEIMDLT